MASALTSYDLASHGISLPVAGSCSSSESNSWRATYNWSLPRRRHRGLDADRIGRQAERQRAAVLHASSAGARRRRRRRSSPSRSPVAALAAVVAAVSPAAAVVGAAAAAVVAARRWTPGARRRRSRTPRARTEAAASRPTRRDGSACGGERVDGFTVLLGRWSGVGGWRRAARGCTGARGRGRLVGRAVLDERAGAHHGDVVGDLADDGEVVGDEQVADAEVASAGRRAARGSGPARRRRAPRPARRRRRARARARARGRWRPAGAGRRTARPACAAAPRSAARRGRAARRRGRRRPRRSPIPNATQRLGDDLLDRSSAGSATRTGSGRRAGPGGAGCAAGGHGGR